MSIFNPFKAKKDNSSAGNGQPSAIEYVEWLIGHMLQNSLTELTIDSDRPLPGTGLSATTNLPPCVPDLLNVVNRLKLLTGVPMMALNKPAEGSFEQKRKNTLITINVRFQEDASKSTCTLRLRTKNVPAGF